MNQNLPGAMTVGLLTAFFLFSGCQSNPEPGADLVLINGRVYTLAWGEPSVDGEISADAPHDDAGWHPDAEAVAVTDGRIVFVGSTTEAEQHVGSATRVFDVDGAVVLPGLVDSHAHIQEPVSYTHLTLPTTSP